MGRVRSSSTAFQISSLTGVQVLPSLFSNNARSRCFGLLFALVLFVGTYCPSWPARAAQGPTAKEIAAIFTPLVSPQEPGLAVLVRLNGRTLFMRGYGRRDLRSGAPIDAHSNFRLASCTKQFTALAVMLLVHDGKLRLDDRLTDIFPDFPAYGRTITIRNLLNHTSGLVAYEDLMDKMYGAPG